MSVSRFWRRLPARYNLIGTKCKKCSHIMFPPRPACQKCLSIQLADYKLKPEGKIISHTTVHIPQTGFEYEVPYVLAIIELDEGPRLTAEIVEAKEEDIKIGSKVKTCFRRIGEKGKAGMIYYGYKFKLVK